MKSILIAGSLLLVLAQHANADSLQYVYDFDAGTIDSIGNNTGGISREECEYVNVTACTWLDLEVVQNGRVLLQLVLDNPLAANLSNEALTNYSIAARGAAFYSISYGAEFGCTSGSYFGGTSDCYVETISISTDAYGAISDWAIGITSEPLSQDEYHPCCESTIPPYNYSIQSDTARSSTRWESSYPPLGGGIGNEVGFSGSEGLGTWSMAVVPVPAAVWLFGSALGLLGWMRKKSPRRCVALLATIIAANTVQAAPMTFSITEIGLTDSEHTASDGYQSNTPDGINKYGYVYGTAARYTEAPTFARSGYSAWLYDGTKTVNIGLTDADHTSVRGDRYAQALLINDSGQVAGYSYDYANESMLDIGDPNTRTSWLYDGTTTINLSLFAHTESTLVAINNAGLVAGNSCRRALDTYCSYGSAAWLYNGSEVIEIGLSRLTPSLLVDKERYVVARDMNEAGHVAGDTDAYDYGLGTQNRSAWLYDGSTNKNIGLLDAEHTQSLDDGKFARQSYSVALNERSEVAGNANRYNSAGTRVGQSAWLYNGATTENISLVDAEHTSIDGNRFSDARLLNKAGQVVGRAHRYDATGTYNGESAWLFDGTSTRNIGLVDAQHTSSSNGERRSSGTFLNESGQVGGYAIRYGTDGAWNGRSAWLFNGTETLNIGLTGALHTRSTDDYRYSEMVALNEAGHAAGIAYRFDEAGTQIGQTAWFYDGGLTVELDALSVRASDGYAFSEVSFLGEDGLVLGYYTLFDDSGTYPGTLITSRAFAFTAEEGIFDLGLAVDEGFDDWEFLFTAITSNPDGYIIGNGWNGSANGAYLLKPSAVPLPPAVWLFGSALGLLGWMRRAKNA